MSCKKPLDKPEENKIPKDTVFTDSIIKPIAHWQFTENQAPFYTKDNKYPLQLGNNNSPARVNLNAIGGGLKFSGKEYLTIPNSLTYDLNIGKYSNKVTVVAWVKISESKGFIAGMWQEDNNNPSRMYGMFINLPLYGSDNKVIGHISYSGKSSPNIIFSRDMSSSGESIILNNYEMCAFTYDGQQIISYKNGLADSSLNYQEPLIDNVALGIIYNKNPYAFNFGLNPKSTSDFTVGAVRLTHGMDNFFKGEIAELMIFNQALSGNQILHLHSKNIIKNEVFRFNFSPSLNQTFYISNLQRYGWDAYVGYNAKSYKDYLKTNQEIVVFSKTLQSIDSYASFNLNSTIPIVFMQKLLINSFPANLINKISFDLNNTGLSKCQVALKIKNKGWILSNREYIHNGKATISATPSTKINFEMDLKNEIWNSLEISTNKSVKTKNDKYRLNNNDIIESFGFYISNSNELNNIARITDVIFKQ